MGPSQVKIAILNLSLQNEFYSNQVSLIANQLKVIKEVVSLFFDNALFVEFQIIRHLCIVWHFWLYIIVLSNIHLYIWIKYCKHKRDSSPTRKIHKTNIKRSPKGI